MAEDDPAELDRYRLDALQREFQEFVSCYRPFANMYAIAAQFALNKVREAEGTQATNVLVERAQLARVVPVVDDFRNVANVEYGLTST